jgi:hypothetical protein
MLILAYVKLASTGNVSGTTTAWFTLAGALGGVLVTGFTTLTITLLNHRWRLSEAEEQRLLNHGALVRHERSDSYVAYWRAWDVLDYELYKLINLIQELPPGYVVRRHLVEHAEWRADSHLTYRESQDILNATLKAEMEWRAAAGAILLTAYPELQEAAKEHIAMTERKLAAAWTGEPCDDKQEFTYNRLINAMQAALMTPIRASQWLPEPRRKSAPLWLSRLTHRK